MNPRAEILRYVEPGALPKRVRFYGLRRKLAGMAPPQAFWLGLLIGANAMFAAVLVAKFL